MMKILESFQLALNYGVLQNNLAYIVILLK